MESPGGGLTGGTQEWRTSCSSRALEEALAGEVVMVKVAVELAAWEAAVDEGMPKAEGGEAEEKGGAN